MKNKGKGKEQKGKGKGLGGGQGNGTKATKEQKQKEGKMVKKGKARRRRLDGIVENLVTSLQSVGARSWRSSTRTTTFIIFIVYNKELTYIVCFVYSFAGFYNIEEPWECYESPTSRS